MFITEEESSTRLSSLDNLINRLQLRKIHNGGRPKGRKNDTTEERLAIATTAIEKGPTAAAEEHGTTISRASLLSKGIVTHSEGSDEELAPRVADKREEAHNKALDIITGALTNLSEQIGEVKKPTDLASIAVSMAKIAERTGGKLNRPDEDNKPKVQVVIYAPRMKDESEYEVIDIGV